MAALDALATWASQATLLVLKDAAAPAAVGVDYAKLWAGYAELYDRVLRVRDNCADDVAAAQRAMLNFAGWFADPSYHGDYPAVLRERLGGLLPEFSPELSRLLKGSMDFLALNYYTSDVVRHASGAGPMEIELVERADLPRTTMGWPIVPEGLYHLLHWLSERYSGLPILITENGAAFDDLPQADGHVDDPDRIAYLREHIAAAGRAMHEGVDLRGYFVWSLLDNLEWCHGFSKRFGLIHCDFRTLKRTIKASGRWYAHLIASDRLDGGLPARAAGA